MTGHWAERQAAAGRAVTIRAGSKSIAASHGAQTQRLPLSCALPSHHPAQARAAAATDENAAHNKENQNEGMSMAQEFRVVTTRTDLSAREIYNFANINYKVM